MPQIIKIEIFVLLLSLIFADRHGAICFQISTAVPELRSLEGNYFQHVKLRKRHLQVFRMLTRPDFQKDAPIQICVRC